MPSRTVREPLLPRAVELARGGDLVAALDELRRERTFDLQAAYAQATRRRHEGGGNLEALELLEVALLARRRRLMRPLRWYEHGVVWWIFQLLVLPAIIVLNAQVYGWGVTLRASAVWIGVMLVVGGLVWRSIARGRRQGAAVTPAVGAAERSELARTSQVEAGVAARVDGEDLTASEVVAAAHRVAEGIGSPVVVLAALRTLELRYSMSLLPAHRRQRALFAEARATAAAELDDQLRARLR